MNEERRATLTIGLWFLSAIVLAALFISAAAQGNLTSSHTELATILLILATGGTFAIWRMKDLQMTEEKTKRRRLDNLLHDLSDDELTELKNRLVGDDARLGSITNYLGDDGEIKQQR